MNLVEDQNPIRRDSKLSEMMDDVGQSSVKASIASPSTASLLADNYNKTQRESEDKSPRRLKLPEKQFQLRQSPLTELLEIPHFKTIHHIFIASLILMLLHTIIHDLTETGTVDLGLESLMWALGEPQRAWTLILALHLTAICLLYPAFYHWAHKRGSFKIRPQLLNDKVALTAFVLFMLVYIYVPARTLWENPLPFASGIVVAMEQARLLMKMYAFVRSNVPRALNHTTENSSLVDQNKEINLSSGLRLRNGAVIMSRTEEIKLVEQRYELSRHGSWLKENDSNGPCPDFTKYLYFLYAPTLIYKDSYPRTNKIRWNHVCWNFAQVLGSALYMSFVLSRFCSLNFAKFGMQGHEINLKQLLQTVFSLMLPGTLALILTFFVILHAWQNAFAEMLYFGDRMFYKDWWNCSSFAVYYKTWNIIVHDWLYTYIFKDAWESGLGKKWKALPTILVFLVSSLFHEYMLCISFHFFFPAVLILFGLFGFVFVFIGNRKRTTPTGNVLFWMAMMSGTGIIVAAYSMEVYARINCPAVEKSFRSFFVPRTIACNAIRFEWN